MNFGYRFMQFMSGRYGRDKLNDTLLILAIVMSVANIFLRFLVLQLVVYVVTGIAIFRMFSRNIEARRRENSKFLSLFSTLKRKKQISAQRRADKTHIYRKCPNCKAVLRLPYRVGKHTTACPKCSNEFTVRVRKWKVK